MRILHINTKDIEGGAARAMYRLHRRMLADGHESRILCGLKSLQSSESVAIFPGRYGWVLNCLVGKVSTDLGLGYRLYPSRSRFSRLSSCCNWAEVILLHNVHGWFFPVDRLSRIARMRPTLWRLHDMWPLTGGCAYSYLCERWRSGCGQCPHLRDYPSMWMDWTAAEWRRKKRLYAGIAGDLVLSAPSNWIHCLASESPLTASCRCVTQPNGVDVALFKPADRVIARAKFGVRDGEKVVMFAAASAKDSWRKGQDLLADVLAGLRLRLGDAIVLLLVGPLPVGRGLEHVRVVAAGRLAETALAECYSAADVFVNLSRADNLPNCLVEACACGVPCVTLATGGCSDVIEDGVTGFSVQHVGGVVSAATSLLSDGSCRRQFAEAARSRAVSRFDVASQARELYKLVASMRGQKKGVCGR